MKATKIGHWPGTDALVCDAHAAQMLAVGQAMGFLVSFTECGPKELCANCLNEQPTERESQNHKEYDSRDVKA